VINTSSAERCWSTYSFIHGVKRNTLNADLAESLVYVHYSLRLLSHYCDAVENNNSKRDATNLEDGTMILERLEDELPPTPLLQISQDKKLEVSRDKRKT
jgi:hypothetical protein